MYMFLQNKFKLRTFQLSLNMLKLELRNMTNFRYFYGFFLPKEVE